MLTCQPSASTRRSMRPQSPTPRVHACRLEKSRSRDVTHVYARSARSTSTSTVYASAVEVCKYVGRRKERGHLALSNMSGAFVIRLLLDLHSLACFCDCDVASWNNRCGDVILFSNGQSKQAGHGPPEISHLKGHSPSSIYQTVSGNSENCAGQKRPGSTTRPFCIILSGRFLTTE